MSLNAGCYECPICTAQGKKSLVRPLQISINDALIGCEDPECWYPFGIDTKSLLVRSSYKTLEAHDASQVIHPTTLTQDNFGHSISTKICDDSVLDDFQLDALLQESTVQLDDDFCNDFNSFLNSDNQEPVLTSVSAQTTTLEQNISSTDSIVPDNATSLLKDFSDNGKVETLPLLCTVSELENSNLCHKNGIVLEKQCIKNSYSSSSLGVLNSNDALNSRDLSERFTDSGVNEQPLGSSGVGATATKPSKSLAGKKTLSPPLKKSLFDKMKYAESDACSIALHNAKKNKKAKQTNSVKRKLIGKPNLNFFMC